MATGDLRHVAYFGCRWCAPLPLRSAYYANEYMSFDDPMRTPSGSSMGQFKNRFSKCINCLKVVEWMPELEWASRHGGYSQINTNTIAVEVTSYEDLGDRNITDFIPSGNEIDPDADAELSDAEKDEIEQLLKVDANPDNLSEAMDGFANVDTAEMERLIGGLRKAIADQKAVAINQKRVE